MSEGFLGRWSKRKLEVEQGKAVEPEPVSKPKPQSSREPPLAKAGMPVDTSGEPPIAEKAPLTLEDVNALTADSDYTRFAAPDVTAEVRNAAMKKLFADPRYNVMDGLDVYTDDYSRPDPIPASMLSQLAGAEFLGLLDRSPLQEQASGRARDVADNPTDQTVAQSEALPQAAPELPENDDADLRLQQDHAAPGEDPGRGSG